MHPNPGELFRRPALPVPALLPEVGEGVAHHPLPHEVALTRVPVGPGGGGGLEGSGGDDVGGEDEKEDGNEGNYDIARVNEN